MPPIFSLLCGVGYRLVSSGGWCLHAVITVAVCEDGDYSLILCYVDYNAGDDDDFGLSSSTPVSWLGSHTESLIAAMSGVWYRYRIRKSEPHLTDAWSAHMRVKVQTFSVRRQVCGIEYKKALDKVPLNRPLAKLVVVDSQIRLMVHSSNPVIGCLNAEVNKGPETVCTRFKPEFPIFDKMKGVGELLEGLIPYSQRHYTRIDIFERSTLLLLDDPDVEAVYAPLPTSLHLQCGSRQTPAASSVLAEMFGTAEKVTGSAPELIVHAALV
ncbi:hypothetical protein Tco_0071806 [Tanacetum coccineum]